MMGTERANITITFIDDEEFADSDSTLVTEEGTNAEISLYLDSDANDNETSFSPGTPVYVKQFPAGEYTMTVNVGNVVKRLRRVSETVTDELVYFVNVSSATLDYLPYGTVSYEWIGTNLGNPVFNGRNVKISEAGIGVLKCTYVTLYDQLMVYYSGEATTLLLVVSDENGEQDSLLITFTAAETIETRPVIITVKDYCSDEVIAGASIELSATGYPTTNFTTNANGEATLGYLTVGVTYNIKITATGYKDSDDDSLSNDSFTVTAEA